MKRVLFLVAAVLAAVVVFSSCGNANNVKIDIGKSSIYTEDERTEVAGKIKDHFFKNFDRCTLHTVKYAGDKWSKDELSYCKELTNKKYTECMIFETDFHSPKENGPDDAWNEDEEYTYNWHFAKEDGGSWEYVCAGQG